MLGDLLERIPNKHRKHFPHDLLVQAVAFGKSDAIDILIGILNAEIETREELNAGIRTTGAIPDSVVNTLVVAMLDASLYFGLVVPVSLRDLLATQLGVKERSAVQPLQAGPRILAAFLLANRPDASNREVARAVGVSHVTVAKWWRDPKFWVQVAEAGFSNDSASAEW